MSDQSVGQWRKNRNARYYQQKWVGSDETQGWAEEKEDEMRTQERSCSNKWQWLSSAKQIRMVWTCRKGWTAQGLHTKITGNRSRGRQRKRWIDMCRVLSVRVRLTLCCVKFCSLYYTFWAINGNTKEDLADKGSYLSEVQNILHDRQTWRSFI